jgi:hypothetical protein
MNEIHLSTINTPENEREKLINKLDTIFENEQLVMSPNCYSTNYYPIKSILHFIKNSPTYLADPKNVIVWFNPLDECLTIRNLKNSRMFCIRLAEKKYLEDFPYIYEGKLKRDNDYIIPIKFK